MEYQKVRNLPDTTSDNVPRFMTKKWIAYMISQAVLKRDTSQPQRYNQIYVISAVHILLLKDILMLHIQAQQIKMLLHMTRNWFAFISCISKINNALIDNAEDLAIVMPIYSLTEYSENYSRAAGTLSNYYRNETNSGAVGIINYSIKHSKYSNCKISITGELEGKNTEEVKIVMPLKHLSNFWRTLDMPLINCEVSLIWNWSGEFLLQILQLLKLVTLHIQHLKKQTQNCMYQCSLY